MTFDVDGLPLGSPGDVPEVPHGSPALMVSMAGIAAFQVGHPAGRPLRQTTEAVNLSIPVPGGGGLRTGQAGQSGNSVGDHGDGGRTEVEEIARRDGVRSRRVASVHLRNRKPVRATLRFTGAPRGEARVSTVTMGLKFLPGARSSGSTRV